MRSKHEGGSVLVERKKKKKKSIKGVVVGRELRTSWPQNVCGSGEERLNLPILGIGAGFWRLLECPLQRGSSPRKFLLPKIIWHTLGHTKDHPSRF